MPVIDSTIRSLHYLYSSWLNVILYALQMLLNQFSNFVGCLSCYRRTDEHTLTLLSMSSQSGKDAPKPWVLHLCSRCLLDQSRSFRWVEFTQPLGVGLGSAVRINNQYSHPVCTGRRTDTYTTINDTWEISRKYWLLTRER